ncbi:MAG: glycosyltransferase family 9 protein, partial [Bacteriovoracaceae bacterium]
LLVKTKIDLLKKQPGLQERNLKDVAGAFNRIYDKQELIDFIGQSFPKNKSLVTSSVTGANIKKEALVVLAPGASFAPKRWPVERFFEVAKSLLESKLCNVCVVAGPNENFCDIFGPLEEEFPGKFKNYQGKLSLSESLAEVAKASLVIGNDSLMGHIAESTSVPSFVIFGPTSESFGFAPHLSSSKIFSVPKLWCRPCSTDGKRECFRKEQYCMLRTAPETVFQAAKSFLINSREVDAI